MLYTGVVEAPCTVVLYSGWEWQYPFEAASLDINKQLKHVVLCEVGVGHLDSLPE